MPSSRCSEPIRAAPSAVASSAASWTAARASGATAQAHGLAAGRRLGGGRELAVAPVRGLARDAERARDGAVGAAGVQRAPGLDALERVELAAQRGQRAQRDLGVGRARRVLEQLGEAVRELYRALQPRSMVTGTPLNAAPPGPARNAITPATSSGSISRLIGVRLEDHLLQHLVLAHAVRRRLVGDLALDQRRADVARADGGGGDAGLAALERERLHQAEHAVLGRDVGGLVGRRDERVRGRDRDEAARSLTRERVPRVLGQQERAGQQDRDDLIPPVLRELAHRRDVLDAGVGDDDVEPAEALQRQSPRLARCPRGSSGRRRRGRTRARRSRRRAGARRSLSRCRWRRR